MATFRIVEVHHQNNIKYYVQRKILWWWCDERVITGIIKESGLATTTRRWFSTEDEAERWVRGDSNLKQTISKEIIV